MNRTQIATASVVLTLAAALPASAYHIDAIDTSPPVVVGGVTLTSADWNANGNLIICESMGIFDDRNTAPPPGTVLHGVGGLCTTGENWETGVNAPGRPNGGMAIRPAPGMYVKLDTCNETFHQLGAGGIACQPHTQENLFLQDHQSGYGWTAEIGAFSCFVPTYNSAAQGVADIVSYAEVDWALYYDRLYAWWAYDGDGWHTPGLGVDPANAGVVGAGWGDDEDGNPSTANAGPGNTAPPGTPLDNEDYWHGHVAMFISAPDSHPGFDLVGSAVTDGPVTGAVIMAKINDNLQPFVPPNVPPFELSDDDFADSIPGGSIQNTGGGFWSNSCGASPACPPTPPIVGGNPSRCGVPFGPVFRAPSVDI